MKTSETYFEGSRKIIVQTDCGLAERFIGTPDEKIMEGEKTSHGEYKK